MKRIMLDMETLDTRPTSVILSIGATTFDPNVPEDGWYRLHVFVNPDQERFGRTMSASTVGWWIGQPDDARSVFKRETLPLPQALESLAYFMSGIDELWGNGADFDNVILADAFQRTTGHVPWKFYQNRCFRTLKNLVKVDVPFQSTKHDALADAMHQARVACEIFKKLGLA